MAQNFSPLSMWRRFFALWNTQCIFSSYQCQSQKGEISNHDVVNLRPHFIYFTRKINNSFSLYFLFNAIPVNVLNLFKHIYTKIEGNVLVAFLSKNWNMEILNVERHIRIFWLRTRFITLKILNELFRTHWMMLRSEKETPAKKCPSYANLNSVENIAATRTHLRLTIIFSFFFFIFFYTLLFTSVWLIHIMEFFLESMPLFNKNRLFSPPIYAPCAPGFFYWSRQKE